MGRWLAPLIGAVGLLVLAVGMTWAELDLTSMNGVGMVGVGALLLVLAGVLAAAVESATRRHRPLSRP